MSTWGNTLASDLLASAKQLITRVDSLEFSPPVDYVYNPLKYAWAPHEDYVRKYGGGSKRVIFLGMNPGPWGMAQTGVPFGEIGHVVGWLGIHGTVGAPRREHPKRPVEGFSCTRSEVSGRRLWSLFAGRFGTAEEFFSSHFVVNYCPLVFMEESGRNRTPDKLPAGEREGLFGACDSHLIETIQALRPEWIIGIGNFAYMRIRDVVERLDNTIHSRVGKILHPSPASPAANRGWSDIVVRQLEELGVW